jgi:histidine triad (HIT) family protein
MNQTADRVVDCLFCKIIAGDIPAKVVYQDDLVYAFADIHPQAPTHLLILPRKHISSLAQTGTGDEALLGHLLQVAAELARKEGLTRGFRIVINSGDEGGQTVDHLHIHLIGGRAMHWPPG